MRTEKADGDGGGIDGEGRSMLFTASFIFECFGEQSELLCGRFYS